MKTLRLVPAALLAFAAATVAGVVAAAPANAAVSANSGCRFELLSVKANELQENNQDEIYFEIGDERTETVKFVEGQSRSDNDFGTFAQTTEFIPAGGSIVLQGWEADFPSADDAIGGYLIYCNPGRFNRTFGANGANYSVAYAVTAL